MADNAKGSTFHVNQNLLPFPSSLCTPNSPPLIVTKCLHMDKPSPVPSCLRVIDASPCEKLSKITFMNAGSILKGLKNMNFIEIMRREIKEIKISKNKIYSLPN